MLSEDEKIWYAIQDIVRNHSKMLYVTPLNKKPYIPNEELYGLKQDLFEYVKKFTKEDNKN